MENFSHKLEIIPSLEKEEKTLNSPYVYLKPSIREKSIL